MKTRIVAFDVLKYILVFISILLVIFMGNIKNAFFIAIVAFIAILIILFDILSIRKKNTELININLKKEIEKLNIEAAEKAETVNLFYNNDFENKGIKKFLESISSISNELNLKKHELEALQEATQIITSTFDVKTIIEYIYSIFNRFTGCDRYLICFSDRIQNILIYKYEFGNVMFGEIGNVVHKESLIINCFESNASIKKTNVLIKKRNIFGDKIAIPLNSSGEIIGVLYIESGNVEGFSNVNMNFLESLSVYVTIAIKNAELFNSIYEQKQEIEALYEETAAVNEELSSYIDELNRTKEELKHKNEELTTYFYEMQTGYFQTVMALANSIEAKDPYTRGHCQRVMEISCEIAKKLNMADSEIEDLKYAAILHDIGKIGIPAAILNKDQKLTEEEFNEIKKHPLIAYNILKDVEFIRNGLNGILQHHERYDGKGYPYGLKAGEICLFAKILCIADAFDAMTSDRPYRKGMPMEMAIKEIDRCKGIQFDTEIATLFIEMSMQIIGI